jgi:uncharacterized protein YicC (UPF0701 family)
MRSDERKAESERLANLALKALKSAFAKLVIERRKTGGSLVLWVNNRVEHVPASEITLPGEKRCRRKRKELSAD